jgi:hypothetical protein
MSAGVTGFVERIKGKLKAHVIWLGSGGIQQLFGGTTWYPMPGTAAIQRLAAAGSTQGAATLITSTRALITVATTNSSKGVKLPVGLTNLLVQLGSIASHGSKVWPNTGNKIGTGSSNSADTTLMLPGKMSSYLCVDGITWVAQRGA